MLEHASLASMLPLRRGGGRHPHQPHSPQQQQQSPPPQQQQPSLASSLGGSSSNVFPGSAAAVTSPLNVASGTDFKGDAKHQGSSSTGGGGGSSDAHARGTGSSSPAHAAHSSQQQQQHRHQQQQQQQPPRVQHRRPRSIHITLRRTRSGSRPVTAQRNNQHNPVSTSRELAGSAGAASKSTSLLSQSGMVPTPPAAAASSPPSGGASGAGRHTPPHQRTPQGLPHQRHSSFGSGNGTLGEVLSPVAGSPQPGPSPAAAAAAMVGSGSPQLTPRFYDAAGATSTTPNTLTSPIPAGGTGGYAGSAVYRASHYDELAGSGNNNTSNANFNGVSNGSGSPRTVNLPGYTPYVFTHARGRSGDAAGGPDGAPAGTQMAMGSSSSSMIGGAGGSAGSLGPSSTSVATGPVPYGAGTLNTFVKPNYAHYPSMLKQAALLPPNMRERVLGPDAGAVGPHGGVPHAGDGGGAHGMGGSHRRPLSSGPVPRRTSSSLSGSYSRVYTFQPPVVPSANPTLSPQPQSCASGGNAGALRSNSMSGYHGVPGLNAYVLPPSDDASLAAAAALAGMQHQTHLMQHPQPQPQGSAWWGHLSNLPTVNLETFSPRMSPRAEMGEGLGANPGAALSMHPQHQQPYPQQQQGQGQAPQRHYRARSYTAGGRQYGNRGVDGQLSLPAATATGTAALFPADTGYHVAGNTSGGGGGVSVANSAASRSLDRSASISSGVPVPPGSAGGALAGASGSTMVQHHHHHRSGSRRLSSSAVATPVPGVTTTLPPAPSLTATCTDSAASTPRQPTAPTTPKAGLADHNTLAGAGGGSGSGTRYSTRVLTASGRAGAAAAAAVAGVSPVVLLQHPSSRAAVSVQSGAFSSAARRSGSSDRVNGLDDSVDSVRCGSLPSTSNTFVSLGDAQGRGAAGAGAGGRYGGGTAVFGAAHRYGREHVDETDRAGDEGGSGAGGASDANPRRLSSGSGGGTGGPVGTSSRYRRYSILTNTTNDDEDDAAAGPPPAAGQLSTLDILRGHQAGANARKDSASGTTRARATRTATSTTTTTATTNINAAAAAAATPTTAIERWRAQDQQRRREEEEAQRRHAVARQQRLTARQWREAFQRLQENKVLWHMRGYIGRGTSGVVYEGVLEDREHTPVAVKVLEVGVPLPMDLDAGDEEGEERASSDAEGHHGRRLTRPAAAASVRLAAAAAVADTPCMSPSQQSALLVLLREVEMMEKLHHENIVTCLRCQVTPVQDRFMELHRQQQQHRHDHRRRHGSPSSSGKGDGQRRSAGADGGDGEGGNNQDNSRHSGASSSRFSGGGNPSPYRSDVALAGPARVPVQVEIVMELCKRGTLASVVRRSPGGQLPVRTARRYLRDVLKGLAYLHRHNFIHRDVKGDNVLISGGDVAKLADFGCSRRIVLTNNVHGGLSGGGGTGSGAGGGGGGAGGGGGSSSLITTHTGATDSRMTTVADYQWFDTTGIAQTMVGTPMFMAPEIIQAAGAPPPSAETPTSDSPMSSTEPWLHHGDDGAAAREGKSGAGADAAAAAASVTGYTASADIWSYGCLVLEVFGRTPWPSAGNNAYHLMKQIEQSVADLPPGVPEDAPADLLHLLRCCFLRDPHRRSSARALLRLPWMTCKDEELEEVPPRRRR